MGRWYDRLAKKHENALLVNPQNPRNPVLDGFERFEGLAEERFREFFEAHVHDHDAWIAFEEKAAILEYEGGLTREEAERAARLSVYGDAANENRRPS